MFDEVDVDEVHAQRLVLHSGFLEIIHQGVDELVHLLFGDGTNRPLDPGVGVTDVLLGDPRGGKDWWGDEPPYHAPVFVLAHRERDDLPMEGGTTFHFVTDGIHSALERARSAAGDRNVAIAGGPGTVNQYLAAGLLDELRVHFTPSIIAGGERLFDGVPPMAFEQVSARGANAVTHIVYRPVR
ncbi:MAG: dihydrofolate reductase family protein [Actinobacteria bacterium]|nr:dihydrofolate reductase family protein [Actinomycetota bacterium]